MKGIKLMVLVAGLAGIAAFFLPLVAVQKSGVEGALSAYRIVVGIQEAQQVVSGAAGQGVGAADIAEANKALGGIKGIVLGIFAPAVLLLVLGLTGVARKKFGRVAGVFSLLLGLLGLGIAAILLSAAKEAGGSSGDVAGAGMYVMLAAAGLGALGGLMALVKPDRG